MDVASVTLGEVLRAARARSAALVPETSAYLALAIGDASARLPYRIEDDLVTLTTEGTVRVARGREGVAPEEGARVLRDHLHRLLSVSAGSMPSLAQAGSARAETGGPDTVVAEIESALIPCNRAAARRSLARLARDTARARDNGRLSANAPPMSGRAAPGAQAPAQPRPQPVQASQPSQPTYAQPSQPTYAQPSQPTYAQPSQPTYAQPSQPTYAQPSQPTYAPAPQPTYAQPSQAAYAPAPQPTYAEAYAPVYAQPPQQTPTRHAPPVTHAPVFAPEPAAPYPYSPSYADVQLAQPVFEVDVEIDDSAFADAGPSPDEMTHRIDLEALGFDHHDATTIDSIEVIEATFERIHAALQRDADATPRLGTACGWTNELPARPFAMDGALGDHVAAALASPAPAAVAIAPRVDEAARALEAALQSGRLTTPRPRKADAPVRLRRLPWQADLGRARKSDVSDLLARFGASDPQRDATTMRRDLKRTVGIDATQLPPRVVATRER